MYIDVCMYKGALHCWERTEENELVHITAPVADYQYLFVKDNTGTGTHFDMNGNVMKRVDFADGRRMKEYAEGRSDICESDVSPVYRYIMDNYLEAESAPILNLAFYDIEVDFDLSDGNGYPSPSNPFGEINSISMYNATSQCYAMFIPDEHESTVFLEDNRDNLPVEIFWCSSERDLLGKFAWYLDDQSIDVFTAWNGAEFDIAYIMARSIINFGRRSAETMYCRHDIPATSRDYVNLYGEETTEWTLKGRTHLDMMLIFKKFNPGERLSFALASVCEDILGESKIDFEDDLGFLYRENPQRFYEYSLHDSRLLKYLNDKTQIMELAFIFASMNGVLFSDVTGAVRPIEQGFMKFCRKKNNIVLPSKRDNQREKFPGAIVYETIAGRHDMVMTVDLTGLYPSTMIMLGLSPETYIMQLTGEGDDYIKVMNESDENVNVIIKENNEVINVKAYELKEIIREQGYTIAASGAIFDGTLGLFAEFVQHGVLMRKHYQKLMAEAYDSGDVVTGSMYNGYQNAVKVNNNSAYGCSGEPSFRLYDIGLSKAITLTARIISKYQAYKANECMNILAEE